MNKKLISTIIFFSVVAALIPVALSVYSSSEIHTHVLEADVSQEDVIDMSTLIVKGQIVSSHVVEAEATSPNESNTAFTVWTLNAKKVLKGDNNHSAGNYKDIDEFIFFKTIGGKLTNGLETGKIVPYEVGQKVLVMLAKDTASIYGNNYYPVSYMQGAYTIEDDGKAKSIEKRHDKTETKLTSKIENRLK